MSNTMPVTLRTPCWIVGTCDFHNSISRSQEKKGYVRTYMHACIRIYLMEWNVQLVCLHLGQQLPLYYVETFGNQLYLIQCGYRSSVHPQVPYMLHICPSRQVCYCNTIPTVPAQLVLSCPHMVFSSSPLIISSLGSLLIWRMSKLA